MKEAVGYLMVLVILGQIVSGNVSLDRIAVWLAKTSVQMLTPKDPVAPEAPAPVNSDG
jgi:hypothetical protein